MLVIVTVATTTTTIKKEEQNIDMKKANKIKCKQKTPNEKTTSKGVQLGTGRNHKDRQSNKEDCKRKKILALNALVTSVNLYRCLQHEQQLYCPRQSWELRLCHFPTGHKHQVMPRLTITCLFCAPGFHSISASVKRNTLFTRIYGHAHKMTPIQNPQFSGAHPDTALSAGL